MTTFFFYSFTNFIIFFFLFRQWHCHNCQNNIYIYIYIFFFTLSAMGLPQLPYELFFFYIIGNWIAAIAKIIIIIFFCIIGNGIATICQNKFFFFFFCIIGNGIATIAKIKKKKYIYIYIYFFLHYRQLDCHNCQIFFF